MRGTRASRRKQSQAVARALNYGVMGGVLLSATYVLGAAPSYSQSTSTARITHKQGGTAADKFTTFRPGPSSNMTLWTSPGFTGGVNQYSQAYGGLGSVTNPTTATFAIKPGTGVNQNDPANVTPHWSASKLTLNFTGNWTTVGQFGPTATHYFSMAYAGINGGAVSVDISIDFYVGASLARTVRSGVLSLQAGSSARTFTSSKLIGMGTVASGTSLRTVGTIVFSADNDTALSQLRPTNFDCGSAPLTANWQLDGGGNWTTAGNWTPGITTDFDTQAGGNDFIPGNVPNVIGSRARFGNLGATPTGARTVNVGSAVTLGTLDIDDDDPFTFSGPGSLNFEVQQGDCVIRTGSTGGGSGGGATDTIDATVVLRKSTTVQTDGEDALSRGIEFANNLVINGSISSLGATQGLTKIGEASLSLNAANTYQGGTAARGGYVDANVTSSLGTGTVLADDGQLNYRAFHAAAVGVVNTAQNSGQIDLGVDPSTEKFALNDLGAVSGNVAELTALNVLAGGNLTVQPGAMIAHEQSFDFAAAGNPVGLFNAGTASYIFGIANDFANSAGFEVTVGSTSGSIWKGFGGDRGNRTFGSDPNTATLLLGIAGTTELVSLHNTTTINARVVNAGTGSIIKRGGGTVVLNNVNNTYAGPITIQSGTLAVGGGLNALTTVNINGLNAAFAVRPGGSVTGTTVSINGGGQLVMNGGSLNCGTLSNADGELHVNAGTLNVTNFMNGAPTFFAQFSGGHTSVGSYAASGTILVDGGRLAVNGALIGTATGTVILDAGTLTTGAGTLSQLHGQSFVNGGVATFGNNLTVGPAGFLRYNGGSINVTGTLTASGGTVLIGSGAQRLLRVGNVATPSGGRVDLNDSDMVARSSTYAAIRTLVTSARGVGAWNGSGITSTAARNHPAHATTLGILTGSQYGVGTAFNGHVVAAGDVLVKYTWYGDSDFNGVIDFDDYAHTDFGFSTGATTWAFGDYDLNGAVNFDDYALIDLAFNVQDGTLRPAMQFLSGRGLEGFDDGPLPPSLEVVVDHYARFGDAYASSFLAAVPEPASASMSAALVFAGMSPRRWRRAGRL